MASFSFTLTLFVALIAACVVQSIDMGAQVPEYVVKEIQKLGQERAEHIAWLEQNPRKAERDHLIYRSYIILAYQDILNGLLKGPKIIASQPELKEHASGICTETRAEGYAKALERLYNFYTMYRVEVGKFDAQLIEKAFSAASAQKKFLNEPKDILTLAAGSQ